MFRSVPHVDSLEALLWGGLGELGTDKHPPVTGWIVIAIQRVVGNPDLSIYLASQICVLVAFIFTYKLARLFVSPDKAVLSVMFLEGIKYYSYYSGFYNVNLSLLMFIPVVVYMCYRAVKTDHMGYWLGTGLSAGLATLCKYNATVELFCLGLFLILSAEGRARMKRPGPYVALLVAFLVVLPHLLWLDHHDYGPIRYISGQAGHHYQSFGEFAAGTLDKLVDEFLIFLAAIVMLAVLYRATPKENRGKKQPIGAFLFLAGVLPYLIVLGIIIFSSLRHHSHWPFPFVGYLVLAFFVRYPLTLTDRTRRLGVILSYAAMAIYGGIHLSHSIFKSSPTFNLDRKTYAELIGNEWDKYSSAPLAYVGGGWDYPCFAASFVPDRPRLFFPYRSVWIDPADVTEKGLMVLGREPWQLDEYRAMFPNLSEVKTMTLPIRNRLGREKLFTIVYAVLPPADEKTESPDA